jgi:hypothetical protein
MKIFFMFLIAMGVLGPSVDLFAAQARFANGTKVKTHMRQFLSTNNSYTEYDSVFVVKSFDQATQTYTLDEWKEMADGTKTPPNEQTARQTDLEAGAEKFVNCQKLGGTLAPLHINNVSTPACLLLEMSTNFSMIRTKLTWYGNIPYGKVKTVGFDAIGRILVEATLLEQ